MIRRFLAAFTLIASLSSTAAAQERVTVGTMRHVDNGALFLAAAQGFFKDEGLELDMTAYASDADVAAAVAGGGADFGLAAFTTAAFNYAGRGLMKAIAAQVREKRDYEGNEILVSNAAYARGQRKPEHLSGLSAAITQVGSVQHYQFAQIARVKKFNPSTITLKPQGSLAAIVNALSNGQVDAAILPGNYARGLLTSNQAKLVAWYSDIDEQQLGGLFAATKVIQERRATVEKFVRAYRRGAAEYYNSLMRHDRYGKRISNAKAREAATAIARYVYPGRAGSGGRVESDAYFMDAHARLDPADITRQIEWYRTQGVIDKTIEARNVMDLSFNK